MGKSFFDFWRRLNDISTYRHIDIFEKVIFINVFHPHQSVILDKADILSTACRYAICTDQI
jgi:hypothetical protein